MPHVYKDTQVYLELVYHASCLIIVDSANIMADDTKKTLWDKKVPRNMNESNSTSLKEASMPFRTERRTWNDRSQERNNARAARGDQQGSRSYTDPNLRFYDREDDVPVEPPPRYTEAGGRPKFCNRLEVNRDPFQQVYDQDTTPLKDIGRRVTLSDQEQLCKDKDVSGPSANISKTECSMGPIASTAKGTAPVKPVAVARTPKQAIQGARAEMTRRVNDSAIAMSQLEWQYPPDPLSPFRKAMTSLMAPRIPGRVKVGIHAAADFGRSIKKSVALLSPRFKKSEKESKSEKERESDSRLIVWPPPLALLAREAKNRMRDDPTLLADISQKEYDALWEDTPTMMRALQCLMMMWFVISTEWLKIFKAENARRKSEGRELMRPGDLREFDKLQDEQRRKPTPKGEAVCTICSSKVHLGPGSLGLPCHQSHVFHADCIEYCLLLDNTCPTCGTEAVAVRRGPDYEQLSVEPTNPVKSG